MYESPFNLVPRAYRPYSLYVKKRIHMRPTRVSAAVVLLGCMLFTGCRDEDDPAKPEAVLASPQAKKKVLIFGIDGCRPDALAFACWIASIHLKLEAQA